MGLYSSPQQIDARIVWNQDFWKWDAAEDNTTYQVWQELCLPRQQSLSQLYTASLLHSAIWKYDVISRLFWRRKWVRCICVPQRMPSFVTSRYAAKYYVKVCITLSKWPLEIWHTNIYIYAVPEVPKGFSYDKMTSTFSWNATEDSVLLACTRNDTVLPTIIKEFCGCCSPVHVDGLEYSSPYICSLSEKNGVTVGPSNTISITTDVESKRVMLSIWKNIPTVF